MENILKRSKPSQWVTREQALHVRELYNKVKNVSEVIRQTGLSRGTIKSILMGVHHSIRED